LAASNERATRILAESAWCAPRRCLVRKLRIGCRFDGANETPFSSFQLQSSAHPGARSGSSDSMIRLVPRRTGAFRISAAPDRPKRLRVAEILSTAESGLGACFLTDVRRPAMGSRADLLAECGVANWRSQRFESARCCERAPLVTVQAQSSRDATVRARRCAARAQVARITRRDCRPLKSRFHDSRSNVDSPKHRVMNISYSATEYQFESVLIIYV
jgi:hypothetical protein